MKQQTAVDWLYEILTTENWEYKTYEEQNEIFQKAKQMEKEQIKKAADTLLYRGTGPGDMWSEQYYNDTYGNQ